MLEDSLRHKIVQEKREYLKNIRNGQPWIVCLGQKRVVEFYEDALANLNGCCSRGYSLDVFLNGYKHELANLDSNDPEVVLYERMINSILKELNKNG